MPIKLENGFVTKNRVCLRYNCQKSKRRNFRFYLCFRFRTQRVRHDPFDAPFRPRQLRHADQVPGRTVAGRKQKTRGTQKGLEYTALLPRLPPCAGRPVTEKDQQPRRSGLRRNPVHHSVRAHVRVHRVLRAVVVVHGRRRVSVQLSVGVVYVPDGQYIYMYIIASIRTATKDFRSRSVITASQNQRWNPMAKVQKNNRTIPPRVFATA